AEARGIRARPARPLRHARRVIALGAGRRRALPRVSHEPRPHDRRRHVGDPADDGRDARARTAGLVLAMDFRPTDAQQLLAHSARDCLARRCRIEAAPDGSGEKASLWPEMAELGWPGLLIPSDLGGSDGTLLDVVLLVEEMGRSALQSPYVGSAVAGTSLLLRGLRGAKRVAVLSDMALGRRISTLALLETTGELDADALPARGEPGGAIDGCKLFARDVDIADDLIVAARGARGISLFHVERSRPGVTYRPMPSMDGERLFDVKLDAVAVSPDDLI